MGHRDELDGIIQLADIEQVGQMNEHGHPWFEIYTDEPTDELEAKDD